MDQMTGPALYHLDRSLPDRRLLKLENAKGTRVLAIAGDVWITEDGRLDDVVLAAGESASLERDGMAMITTFDSADVEVVRPVAAELPGASWNVDPIEFERHAQAARHLRAQTLGAMFTSALNWVRERLRPSARLECCG